jgi:hypothetical protein
MNCPVSPLAVHNFLGLAASYFSVSVKLCCSVQSVILHSYELIGPFISVIQFSMRRCEDNIKINLRGIRCEGRNWIKPAKYMIQWRSS